MQSDKIYNMQGIGLHSVMCSVGGFMGAFALLTCYDNLGSAQTSNMLYIVLNLLSGNMTKLLMHIGAFVLYVIAIESIVVMSKKTHIDTKKYCIIVEVLCVAVILFMPKDEVIPLKLYPIFYMMATQWTVFHGIGGYNSSTIFSTNNLKQAVISMGEYAIDKKPEQLKKGKFFLNSILWYHVGAAIAFLGNIFFWQNAVLICCLPLAAAFIMTIKLNKTENSTVNF